MSYFVCDNIFYLFLYNSSSHMSQFCVRSVYMYVNVCRVRYRHIYVFMYTLILLYVYHTLDCEIHERELKFYKKFFSAVCNEWLTNTWGNIATSKITDIIEGKYDLHNVMFHLPESCLCFFNILHIFLVIFFLMKTFFH